MVSLSHPERATRRLAAIAFADVVGFSRLMAMDEAATFRRWSHFFRTTLRPEAAACGGEITDLKGDGALVAFPTGPAALAWAQRVHAAAADTAEPGFAPLVLRIGINLGEIFDSADGLFGDAVNLAARLQQHAAPGGTTISASLRAVLHDPVLTAGLVDLGKLRFKNDHRPFQAYAVGGGHQTPQPRVDGEVPAIAVLPLVNASGDAGDDYLAAGIVDDIILSLSGLRELAVIARGSTTARQVGADPEAAGRELGARYVLTGTLHRIGGGVRVATRLLNVESGQTLWGDRQDCAAAEVFDLQDRIVQRIVAGAAPNIRAAELRGTLRKRPENMSAYDHLLRGVHLIYATDRAVSLEAKRHLDAAIAADPGFALPLAYGAWWHVLWIGQGWAEDPEAMGMAAFDLSGRALAIDPDSALALAAHGHILSFLRRQYDAAMVFFDRALIACPNHAFAWMLSSGTLAYLGRATEAVARAEQALRLSPLDQARYLFDTRLSLAHYAAGNHAEAVRWGQRARSANPGYTAILRILVAALVGAGAQDEAVALAAELQALEPRFRLSRYAAGLQPFAAPAIRDRFLGHLHAAGLPA